MSMETNIAICGAAKHGKSTLGGRLLFELGALTDQDLDRALERVLEHVDSASRFRKDLNRFSAPLLAGHSSTFDPLQKTQDPSRTEFPTRARLPQGLSASAAGAAQITLVDTPGFERFLRAIVYGMFMSDAAIIVVEAQEKVVDGAERLARILASFAIPVWAVCVTKMDRIAPDLAEDEFEAARSQVVSRIFPYFERHGLALPPVLPVSALAGKGIQRGSRDFTWYKGDSLLDVLANAREPARQPSHQALRFVVKGGREIYQVPGVGTVIVGILESGILEARQDLLVEPMSTISGGPMTLRVHSIQRARSVSESRGENLEALDARAVAAIRVKLGHDEAEALLRRGAVLSTVADPARVTSCIDAEMVFFDYGNVFLGREYQLMANASVRRARILALDESHRRVNASEASRLGPYSAGPIHARLSVDMPVCIEYETSFERLCRFLLRDKNQIVACGRCIHEPLTILGSREPDRISEQNCAP